MHIKIILKASKEVLSKRNYLIGFFILALFLFFVFIAIPILTIPGNSLSLQLTIFKLKDYSLLIFLSILTSLMFIMQFYLYKNARIIHYGKTAIHGISGFTGAIFGTASCASCIAVVFGFLGAGTVLFLVRYKWYVTSFAIIFMLTSIYFSSLKINNVCKNCEVRNGYKRS